MAMTQKGNTSYRASMGLRFPGQADGEAEKPGWQTRPGSTGRCSLQSQTYIHMYNIFLRQNKIIYSYKKILRKK